jgi:tellurite resistance protein TerC
LKQFAVKSFSQAKRIIVTLTGFTVIAIGVAMIVLPGPAVIVIPIGLAILATEYAWAQQLLDTVKQRIMKMKSGNSGKSNPN